MKKVTLIAFLTLFLFSGMALAVDLNGIWLAENWCVPDDANGPYYPVLELSCVEITQVGQFFTSDDADPSNCDPEGDSGLPDETCGGVVQGKEIHMTCPGTIFHGKMRGKNKIVGINHVPADGKTCYIEARRQ